MYCYAINRNYWFPFLTCDGIQNHYTGVFAERKGLFYKVQNQGMAESQNASDRLSLND
jgi:hypothetical protein